MNTNFLSKKIDFAVIFSVKNANPNGDPLNGNRPRTDYEGYGEITDVCLKRKIRDRLQEGGTSIFVQSDEKKIDDKTSLKDRFDSFYEKLQSNEKSQEEIKKKLCEKWFDIRSFGQILAFKDEENSKKGISIPIRGPVTIQSAFSLAPVEVISTQITKSVSGQKKKTQDNKSSDTMGMKHRVKSAVYVAYGAINPQLAERTGFSDDDAREIKEVLPKLFQGDASSARPEGSMKVDYVIWWEHDCKLGQYPSIKVHSSLRDLLPEDEKFDENELKNKLTNLEPEIIEGW